MKQNDTFPGKCVFCYRDKKPSFTEYYCDCRDEITERIELCEHGSPLMVYCVECHSEKLTADMSMALQAGIAAGLSRTTLISAPAPTISGVQMAYWLECMVCHDPAFYVDHDPLSRPGERISPQNGYYQMNTHIVPNSQIRCDSCSIYVDFTNLIPKYLHKY